MDDSSAPITDWETHLPRVRGTLPNGAPLSRTDPSGRFTARVMILGAYPAATATRPMTLGLTRMQLPVSVEVESFEPTSKSGRELDEHYLRALGLSREDVLVTDLLPYFLANTTKSSSGRSMADNLALHAQHTGTVSTIEARPEPSAFSERVRSLKGNEARLTDYFGRCRPRLLLTLGAEVAAYVRGVPFETVEASVASILYAPAESRVVFGVRTSVVHLVHPHLFIKRNARWMERHRRWVDAVGRDLVRDARGAD